MAVADRITERRALERWYRLDLRPKVARAAELRAIDPAQAAEFELTMTALLDLERKT
jgi:hypothetical protein